MTTREPVTQEQAKEQARKAQRKAHKAEAERLRAALAQLAAEDALYDQVGH